eukprot:m.1418620 g.1418620  ORF g.1418620 m.1418620 type:complete len:161 (-) comp25038_c0_seq21:4217-4699(-)
MSERLMSDINRSWEDKLRQSEQVRDQNLKMMEQQGVTQDLRKINNRLPNLVNLNEDPQLSEMLIYIIKEGVTTVGKDADNDIELSGVFVRAKHAAIHCSEDNVVTVRLLLLLSSLHSVPEINIRSRQPWPVEALLRTCNGKVALLHQTRRAITKLTRTAT